MDKVISIGSHELSEGDLGAVEYDLIIYSYEEGSYDGSGFAAFKKGEKWFYHELGHCSCYGPMDNIEKSELMLIDLPELLTIADKGYGSYSKDVADYLRKNYV